MMNARNGVHQRERERHVLVMMEFPISDNACVCVCCVASLVGSTLREGPAVENETQCAGEFELYKQCVVREMQRDKAQSQTSSSSSS